MCNCKWTEIILGVIILVFAIWETAASKWLVVIAAALIIIHSLTCKSLAACGTTNMSKAAAGKKK